MNKVVSDDSARRALQKIDEAQGIRWLQKHLYLSYAPLLKTPWILDADVTLQPDGAARVLKAFDQSPSLAALFGSYDDSPRASNFLSQYKNLFHHYVHQNAHERAFTFWSGCGAIRRCTCTVPSTTPWSRR